MKQPLKLLTLLFIIALSSISCAGNKPEPEHKHESHKTSPNDQPVRLQLSPDTTELLVREMRELQEGMKKIVPALVAGEWQKIAFIGKQMEDSYIMKESLTKAQMHELHESLPETFQVLDHGFHTSAGLLAQAAEQQNREQVSYYYYKVTEACVECHSLYATHKFPEFIKSNRQ